MRSLNQPPKTAFKGRPAIIRSVISLCCACIALLGGCVVGPDYAEIPAERIPASYQNLPAEAFAGQVSLDQWWTHFADPTLTRIVNEALSKNPGLREMLESVVGARANYRLQTGQLAPDASFIGGYDYLKRSQNAQPFVGSNGDPFNRLNVGFGAAWEIDLFGRIERTIEAANADIHQRELDTRNLRRVLIGDIASSYVRVRLFQNQVQLALQSVDLQRQTKALIEERINSGISTDLDKVQTDAFILRSQALVSTLQQQLQLELNNLSALIGIAPGNDLLAFIGEAPIPQMPPIPSNGFPADLVRRRPDVQRDEWAVAQATALIGVAEADLYPQLTLIGNIGLSAQGISSLFETDALLFNVGPSITWNIFNFGRVQANIEVQESNARQAYWRYQQTALQAVREVEDTITQQRAFQEQWLQFQAAVGEDRKAAMLAFDRYKVGRINFQRLLDTQQQLLQDQQLMVEAQANAIDQIVRMFRALGGGWQNESPADVSLPLVSHQADNSAPITVTNEVPLSDLLSPFPAIEGHDLDKASIFEPAGQATVPTDTKDFKPIPKESMFKQAEPAALTPGQPIDALPSSPQIGQPVNPTSPGVSDMFDEMILEWDSP